MRDELELATRSALAAGRMLRVEFARGSVVQSETGRDIKLAADVQAEEIILRCLRAGSPHPILSEEAGEDASFAKAGLRWVVDPLDGTFNFSRRLPVCCVSIGLCDGERPILGVVHDFVSGVTFTGLVGEGAWRNGQPMRASAVANPQRAAICTGFPTTRAYDSESLLSFVRLLQQYKRVRLLGSAALSLALVASGVVEVYHEEEISFWDAAAGIALVLATGGSCVVRPGSSRWQMEVFASNGLVPVPERLR